MGHIRQSSDRRIAEKLDPLCAERSHAKVRKLGEKYPKQKE